MITHDKSKICLMLVDPFCSRPQFLAASESFYRFAATFPYIPYYRRDNRSRKMADAERPKKRKCDGADCDNDAEALRCPNCHKLGKESYFCSQECFKRNWVISRSKVPVEWATTNRSRASVE